MADSKEQKIVAHAVTSLGAINGTGDYLTALATTNGTPNVADGRSTWQQEELPAISIFTGRVEPADIDDENQKVLRKLPLAIIASLARDTTESDARKLLSDIFRVIRSIGDEWTVSGTNLAHRTDESGHGIERTEETFEIVGVQVEIDVYYIASKFNMES